MDVITFAALLLSTARLTRLVAQDKITEPLRVRAFSRISSEGMLAYLIVCDWCVSVYTGALVSVGWWAFGGQRWFDVLILALSASYAAGFLNSKADD